MTNKLSFTARIYFKIREWKLLRRYMRRLRNGDDQRLTGHHSFQAYQAYDNREQLDYERESVRTLQNGSIERVPFKEIREYYLSEVYAQIDELLSKEPDQRVKILEVGCGNCINAMRLLEKYGDRIEYAGFDLSPQRIEVSHQHWGSKLEGAKLSIMSATDMKFPDKSMDIVFSMHVLEQISYLVGEALDEMLRVAARRIVLIEPTYEFGNPAQRLKLVLNDQLRTLLPELQKRAVKFVKSYPATTLANPTNPTGIHVVDISQPEGNP